MLCEKKSPKGNKMRASKRTFMKITGKSFKKQNEKVANFIIKSKRCFSGRYEFMMKE